MMFKLCKFMLIALCLYVITCMFLAVHGMAVNVTCVEWLDDNTLVTSGQQDCSIRLWHIPN